MIFKAGEFVINNNLIGVVSADSVGNATPVLYFPLTHKFEWTDNDSLIKLKNEYDLKELLKYHDRFNPQ